MVHDVTRALLNSQQQEIRIPELEILFFPDLNECRHVGERFEMTPYERVK